MVVQIDASRFASAAIPPKDEPPSFSVVSQLEKKNALSVPKGTGRRGLYKTVMHSRGGFVEAAHI
jgi:hypothetical protein